MYSVYVLNKHGRPLMPCSPAKARHLLKDGKAVVKHRTPFTIQLIHGASGYKQEVILGVDAGSKTIGLSASTKTKELFAANVLPRNDVVNKLSTRREFRRARRNRKTRHRQARFNNRVHSKHKGWFAPSVEVKIQEHITPIKRICDILPISKVVVETAEFDLQKIKAVQLGEKVPEGEDYQKGEMYGEYNVRQYVLKRDNYSCRICGCKEAKFHVHHIETRKAGGNAPDNLITLCENCHEKLHKGAINPDVVGKRKLRSTRDAAFMGIMRKTLICRLTDELDIPVAETMGYITKATRTEYLQLAKTHTSDALAIAQGKHGFDINHLTTVELSDRIYVVKPVKHHNRQLHRATILKNGIRKANQAIKYVFGYRLFDKVQFNGQDCFIWARRTSGYFAVKTIDGKVIHNSASFKKLKLLEKSSNYLIA
jgi:N6-L-threonylcarbamoyladenine synthase